MKYFVSKCKVKKNSTVSNENGISISKYCNIQEKLQVLYITHSNSKDNVNSDASFKEIISTNCDLYVQWTGHLMYENATNISFSTKLINNLLLTSYVQGIK